MSIHPRVEAIDEPCKTKRSSQETGLSFRYWWKVPRLRHYRFSRLTVSRYDEILVNGKPADAVLDN